VSRRKLSPRDYTALNRARPVTTYPPGGGRAELRVPTTRELRRRRKRGQEEGG